ncbi:MAG TPA: hypothetical protein VJV39_09170 [Dongiaceae bacterium]|nr:hypothetical protein [Dongiaceae bacterium]
MSDKTEAEKWAEWDARMAKRHAERDRPWSTKDSLFTFLYWGLLIGFSWGTVALGAHIIHRLAE